MKILAVNGSPRKKWNTATLLDKALEGAASEQAETELIHLYDLDFKGCVSCFACKTLGGDSYGKCTVKDSLTPILNAIEKADAVIFGSPIYFGSVSGAMRSFMERLFFPYLMYSDPLQSLFPRKIKSGFIYTMNLAEKEMSEYGIDRHLFFNDMLLHTIFGHAEKLFCFDTCQFNDYSKVFAERFDPVKKAERRKEVFPRDCEKAFDMGVRFALKND